MEHGPRKLNVSKVTWTLRHALSACLAFEVAVYCAHSRIHQAADLRLVRCFIHNLSKFDFCNRVCFLSKLSTSSA